MSRYDCLRRFHAPLRRIVHAGATALLVAGALGAAQPAHALDSALERLTSAGGGFTTYDEGRFRTATRHGYTAGGLTMRFQHNRYSLVRVDPPRLEIGCHGVDAHFGGFSYIDSEQIQQMLEQIAQGVAAMAFQLALKQLCPMCGDVLEFAQRMAQEASKLAMDTCRASEALVDGFPDYREEARNLWCGSVNMFGGVESDWLAAQQQTCAGPQESGREMAEQLADASDGDRMAAADIHGNRTWKGLQAIGIAPSDSDDADTELRVFAELLMSWIGTTISNQEDEDSGDRPTDNRPPLITDTRDLLHLFLCGDGVSTDGGDDPLAAHVTLQVQSFCEDRVLGDGDRGKLRLYQCPDDDLEECWDLREIPASHANLGHYGFLGLVSRELADAVGRVANDEPLSDTQKGLIAAAPFPLYQAINVAATYLDVAYDLVTGHSMVLSYMIAIEYLRHALQTATQRAGGGPLPRELLQEMHAAQQDMRTAVEAVARQINTLAETQESIMNQVNQINRATLRNLHAMGLSGAEFARDLVREAP